MPKLFKNQELIFSIITILTIVIAIFVFNFGNFGGSNSSENSPNLSNFNQTRSLTNQEILEKRKTRLEQITSISSQKLANLTKVGNNNLVGDLGKNKVVAIFDTGVDKSHFELENSVLYEACFSTNSGNSKNDTVSTNTNSTQIASLCTNQQETSSGNFFDHCKEDIFGECGHGTAVASLISGKYGIAPNAKILSFQIYSKSNLGLILNLKDFQKALEKLLDLINTQTYKVEVLNLSFNTDKLFETYCDNNYPEIANLIQQLLAKKVQIVVSSGNLGKNNQVQFPACFSGIKVVGSVDNGLNNTKNGEISKFSNQNSKLIPNYHTGNWLEVGTFDLIDKTKAIKSEGTSLASGVESGLLLVD